MEDIVNDITKVTTLTDAQLNSLATVEDAIKALGVNDLEALNWDNSPWQLIEDKSKLVGKKFLAVQWTFRESKEYPGNEYVSVYVITADTVDGHTHFIVNDGSTGICQQLRALSDTRAENGHPTPFSGALVKNGLKLSEYERVDAKGVIVGKGKTYYLAN